MKAIISRVALLVLALSCLAVCQRIKEFRGKQVLRMLTHKFDVFRELKLGQDDEQQTFNYKPSDGRFSFQSEPGWLMGSCSGTTQNPTDRFDSARSALVLTGRQGVCTMRIQYQILVPGQSPKRGQFQGNFSISDIEVSIVAGTKNSTNPWLQASCNFLGKIVNDPDKSSDVDPQHVAMIEEALNSQMFPFVNKIFSDICTNANVGTQNAINFVLQDYTPQAMFPLTLSTEIKWDRSILDAKVTADGAIFLVNGTFVDYPVPPSPAPTFADFNISLGQVQIYIDWNLAGELLNVSIGSDYNSFLFTDETAIPHFSMVMGKFYGIETTEGKIAANYDASARLAINCTWPAEEKPVLDLTSPGNLHAILTYRCALLTYDEQSKPVDTKIAFLSKFRAEFGVNSLTMRSALNLTVKSFQQQAETVVLNAKPLTPERQRILDRTVLYYAQQYRLAKDIETLGKYWPIPDMKNANYEKLESYLHVFGDVPEA